MTSDHTVTQMNSGNGNVRVKTVKTAKAPFSDFPILTEKHPFNMKIVVAEVFPCPPSIISDTIVLFHKV